MATINKINPNNNIIGPRKIVQPEAKAIVSGAPELKTLIIIHTKILVAIVPKAIMMKCINTSGIEN